MAIGVALGPGIGSALGGGVSLYQRLWNEVAPAALYDPSDLTSLYQSRTGGSTGAADAVVGIMLDKSLMGNQTTASFIAGQPELRGNGVVGLIGTATAATYNTATGAATVARGANVSNQSYVQWSGLGSTWVILDVENTGAEAIGVRSGGSSSTAIETLTAGQRKAVLGQPGSGLITIGLTPNNNVSGAFTVHSFKQIPGYHALAPSDAARPILRQANGLSYLETDGVDDWMNVFPALNLGEAWWHVGGWQATTAGGHFGLSNTGSGGIYSAGAPATVYQYRNAANSAYVNITSSTTLSSAHVLTVEQASTASMTGGVNAANSVTTSDIYDDSGATQGLALFSGRNNVFVSGLAGRFYGGLWKPAAFTSSQRAIAEQWAALKAGVTL